MFHTIIWNIDNLETIGGNRTTVLGSPVVIDTPDGPAVEFNGKNDAIILDANPLAGASEFTIEVIFRPDARGLKEQRFLHMQEVNDRRVLIETRLTDDNQWFLDTYIKSDQSDRTLFAKDFLHPVGRWYHAALVYKDQQMRHYVNGKEELDGTVYYVPVKAGQVSIGCRLNRVCWFKGAIRKVKVTHRALLQEEFIKL